MAKGERDRTSAATKGEGSLGLPLRVYASPMTITTMVVQPVSSSNVEAERKRASGDSEKSGTPIVDSCACAEASNKSENISHRARG